MSKVLFRIAVEKNIKNGNINIDIMKTKLYITIKIKYLQKSHSNCTYGVDVGGEAWQWRRRLWAWEENLLEECKVLLLTVSLQEPLSDRWLWYRIRVAGIQFAVCMTC
jgi:hypothetical protein